MMGPFLSLIAVLLSSTVFLPEPSFAGSTAHRGQSAPLRQFGLSLTRNQLSYLKRLDYSCLQAVAGDWLKHGPYTAVLLTDNGKPRCIDGEGPGPEAGSTVWGKVIPLRRAGVNLIRINQNFGGSGTLTTYGLVSVVQRRIGGKREDVLLIHYILPPAVSDDQRATALANLIAAKMN